MAMTDDVESIRALLNEYFDALHHCDVALLERVFHPLAIYATADEQPFLFRRMPEYLRVVAARQSPAARGEARRDHIDAIELAGANTAMARVRCSIASRNFTDLLSLVRVDGRWQIIAKVFQIIETG